MSKVEITVGSWGQGSLLVDGDDISKAVSGFSLQTRVGTVPVLRVDLLAEPTYLTGEMDVRMADATYAMLCRAGWTPPDRGDVIELPVAAEPESHAHGDLPPCPTCKGTGAVEVVPYGDGPCPDCTRVPEPVAVER